MSYVWRLNDEKDLLKGAIAGSIAHIRSPAGNKYKSKEDIAKSPDEFGRDFHKGLFEFHLAMIEQILLIEDRLRGLPAPTTSADRTRTGAELSTYGKYFGPSMTVSHG
jgi:hypothetical protein